MHADWDVMLDAARSGMLYSNVPRQPVPILTQVQFLTAHNAQFASGWRDADSFFAHYFI